MNTKIHNALQKDRHLYRFADEPYIFRKVNNMKDLVLNIIMQTNEKASQAFQRIKRAAADTNSTLSNSTQALAKLNQTVQKADRFANLHREMQQTAQESSKLSRQIQDLSQAIAKIGKPTSEQITQMGRLDNAARKTADFKNLMIMLIRQGMSDCSNSKKP